MSEGMNPPMEETEEQKPSGPIEIHHEHESSYVLRFWQDGKPVGIAAQLVFTAGFDWPEVRFYHPSAGTYTTVPGVSPEVLVALGELCKVRLEPVEAPVPMACPGCRGRVIVYEPESVICVECGSKTDTYEAMKAAEPEPRPQDVPYPTGGIDGESAGEMPDPKGT